MNFEQLNMNFEQLKAIGRIDQLKAKNLMTQEEYDAVRARILATPDNPSAVLPKSAPQPTKPRDLLYALVFFGVLLGGALLIRSCIDSSEDIIADSNELPDLKKFEQDYKSSEDPFNPDLLKSSYLLTIKNRNSIAYKNCELTINDRFKAKVPKIDPYDTYIVPYRNLVDDDGLIYNPSVISMMEVEFYCKDYNGHSDGISLEKK